MSHTQRKLTYAQYRLGVGEYASITTVAHCGDYVIGLPSEYQGGNYRDGDPSGTDEEDARRLVACWNAADGIPTAELEAAADGRLLNIFEGLIRERDELLEALELARDHIDMKALEVSHCKDAERISSAIARVKGGEA